jgi:exosortase A
MARIWTVNETFTHGFLVLPLVIWLIWQKKTQISLIKPNPEPWALLLLVPFLIGWLIGSVVGVEIVQQFCMVTIILVTVWIVVGRKLFFYIIFPLMFLYFAVPFGQVFIPALMQYTASFSVTLIKLVGIPVYQDGLSFTLPTGSWSVVEECSGVRYLIASFFLGSIYAYLNFASTKKRVIFILLSLIVPIIGNGLRAFGIVMIGHFSGMKLAVGADHLLYGWVFFGFIIFLLFYMGSFWRDSEEELKRVNINNEEQSLTKNKEKTSFVFLATIFLFIISLSIFANQIDNEKRKERGSVLIQLPVNFSGWQYSTNKFFNWKPISKNADATLSRAYVLDENGKNIVQLDIAYYQIQRQGAEAVSWGNRLTHPHGGEWKLTSAKDVLEGGQHFTESEIKYPGIKLLVWRWYRMGEYETPNSYIAKAYEVYNFIIKGRSDASVISIATEVAGSADMARQKLAGFWQVSANGMNNELDKIQLKQEQIEQKQIEKKSEK